MPARGFPADICDEDRDGRYTDGRVVTADMNGDLAIKGPLASAPTLSGTINLGKTVITVPERLPGSLADARRQAQERDGRGAGAGAGAGAAGRRPAAAPARLTLDLTVNAPQPDLRHGPRPRRRTRRQPEADRIDRGAAGRRAVHAAARAAVHPRQAADLHARHDRLRRLAGAVPRPRGRLRRPATHR